MMLKVLAFLLFSISSLFSQNFEYYASIGSYKDASSFHINSAGFIFVTDLAADEVYKIDTLGNILKYAGGYGWNTGSFDNPVHVFSTPLNSYVSDYNNHRIQFFDKDLNYISALTAGRLENNESRFGYPLASVVSPQGDLYVLDSENKRIIKFDLFGNFISNFAGYDWGDYALTQPSSLSVSPGNNLFVADGKNLLIYDQYGNGTSKLSVNENILGVSVVFSKLTFNTSDQIFNIQLNSQPLSVIQLNLDGVFNKSSFINSFIFNNKLYVLTKTKILVFIRS